MLLDFHFVWCCTEWCILQMFVSASADMACVSSTSIKSTTELSQNTTAQPGRYCDFQGIGHDKSPVQRALKSAAETVTDDCSRFRMDERSIVLPTLVLAHPTKALRSVYCE